MDRYTVDMWGRLRPAPDTSGMFAPVRCTHCGGVYDMGAVTVTARYTDCSIWKAPCCERVVDDRAAGWKPGRSDIEELRR
jgi:hypothetical protein